MKPAIAFSALCLAAAPLMAQQQDPRSLSPVLMYVADRQSADAAAPRVAALISQAGDVPLRVDPYDLLLLRSTACFGSPELQKVMAPYLPKPSAQAQAEIKPHLVQLEKMWQSMDDLRVALAGVRDAQSAQQAAEMLESFLPYMMSCSEKIAQLTPPTDAVARRELRLRYLTGTRRCTAALLRAWADLQQRDADYYHSERLMEALLGVRDVLENMDMRIDPDAIPAARVAARKLLPLTRQWIAVAALIRDADTASAAAVQLDRLHEEMRTIALSAGLSRSFEEDLFLISPELEVQVHVMDRITHFLQDEVSPPCFGSERLKSTLEHED